MFSSIARPGKLEVYYGPMCSGKTLKLRSRLSEFLDIGVKTCYINSSKDTRSSSDSAYSTNSSLHSNTTLDSFKLKSLSEHTSIKDFHTYNVIGVDESQFFDDLLDAVNLWISQGKIVLVAGLNGNYKMEKFGQILDLIPISDHSEHLKSHCKACLRDSLKIYPNNTFVNDAPFTLRTVSSTDETLIGGSLLYSPVCRYHYHLLNGMSPDDRSLLLNHH